jgi:quercetin dioxygenase-like cupin family protein
MSDTITRVAGGHRLRWHVTAADSAGRLARAELWCAAGSGAPHHHARPRTEERLELLAGALAVEVGGTVRVLRAGESIRLPAGVPHRWWVDGIAEAHVFVEVDAPGAFEARLAADATGDLPAAVCRALEAS